MVGRRAGLLARRRRLCRAVALRRGRCVGLPALQLATHLLQRDEADDGDDRALERLPLRLPVQTVAAAFGAFLTALAFAVVLPTLCNTFVLLDFCLRMMPMDAPRNRARTDNPYPCSTDANGPGA